MPKERILFYKGDIMAVKKYNPYSDVAKVVNYKSRYNQGKATGDPNYRQYNTEAQTYYNNLVKNGYADVADELHSVDYDKSVDILKRYNPDLPHDDFYSELIQTTAQGAGKSEPSPAVERIMDSFAANDKLLNGDITYDSKGNVVSGLNTDHYNTGKNQLGRLDSFDVTKESYYEPIMSEFNLKGRNAAQGEYASGGANNAGNIDSYAAANANRQQLAFKNAGFNAALAQANQNQGNWQTLYDSMTGHLGNMGSENSKNLATGANMYATDSAERQNALNAATELSKQDKQNELNRYIADLEATQNRENNDTTLKQANINADLQRYIAEIEATTGRQASANEVEAARIAAEADKYAADRSYDSAKYKADSSAMNESVKKTLEALGYTVNSDGTVESDEAAAPQATTEDTVTRVIYAIENGDIPSGVTDYASLRDYLVRNGLSRGEVEKELKYWMGENGKPYLFEDVLRRNQREQASRNNQYYVSGQNSTGYQPGV